MQEKKTIDNYKYNAPMLKSFIRAKITKQLDQIPAPFCLYADE